MHPKKIHAIKRVSIALILSFLVVLVMYAFRIFLKTDTFISDTGGISAFASIFGTLYGITVAFVIFEVWGQFNRTSALLDKEGAGLERLYAISLYFRDKILQEKMKKSIKKYAVLVIKDNFQKLGEGIRNPASSKAFREILAIIKDIKFDDDHDSIAFQNIITHYDHLSEIRTERINQSLARLPHLLKIFMYSSSLFTIFIFITMPFANQYYGFLITYTMAFVIFMIFQIIEDLDNPFIGFWTLTPEPFERALKHIEEDY